MDVSITADAAVFAAAAGDWLARRPVENNLLLSPAFDPASLPPGDGEPTFAWVTGPDRSVAAAAWSMPPYWLTISAMPPEAAAALAQHLMKNDICVPGVNGPAVSAAEFAYSWAKLTGEYGRPKREQWLMRCDKATRPPAQSGHARPARPDEVATIADWFSSNLRDSGLEPAKVRRHTGHLAEDQLAGNRLVVWEVDGEPVGAAGWKRPVAGVARPAGIFVLPEHRQDGYAAALLGEVTALALENGSDTCTCQQPLDQTSMQAVLEKVGYRRVWDVTEYRFD
jgi:predicted GNAT family acetyltransferase